MGVKRISEDIMHDSGLWHCDQEAHQLEGFKDHYSIVDVWNDGMRRLGKPPAAHWFYAFCIGGVEGYYLKFGESSDPIRRAYGMLEFCGPLIKMLGVLELVPCDSKERGLALQASLGKVMRGLVTEGKRDWVPWDDRAMRRLAAWAEHELQGS